MKTTFLFVTLSVSIFTCSEAMGQNQAPQVRFPIPDIAIQEDAGNKTIFQDLSYYFTDPDQDVLKLDLSFPSGKGAWQWVGKGLAYNPFPDFYGNFEVIVKASDASFSVQDTFTVHVAPVNDAPRLLNNFPAFRVTEDPGETVLVSNIGDFFYDPEGDPIRYRVQPEGGELGIRLTSEGQLTINPLPDWDGYFWPVLSASDGRDSAYFELQVYLEPVNDAPVWENAPDTLRLCQGDTVGILWKKWVGDVDDAIVDLSVAVLSSIMDGPSLVVHSNQDTLWLKASNGQRGLGFVQLRVQDDEGAFQDKKIHITIGAPDARVTQDGPLLKAVQTESQSFQWFKDNQPLNGEINPAYTATAVGAYRLQATQDSCSVLSEPVIITDDVLGIDEKHWVGVSAYPNPFEQHICLSGLPKGKEGAWVLLDIQGRVMRSGHCHINTLGRLDVSFEGLDSGMFVLKLHFKEGIAVIRLMR